MLHSPLLESYSVTMTIHSTTIGILQVVIAVNLFSESKITGCITYTSTDHIQTAE